MSEFVTDNQIYPVCPWCGEELDPTELGLDAEESISEDYRLSVDVICPACNRDIEITANLVYTTYKSEEGSGVDDDFLEESYDFDRDYDG